MNKKTGISQVSLNDVRGLGRLGFDATMGITSLVETMHANIATVPGQHKEHRTAARGISGFVYRCVRGVTNTVGIGVDGLLRGLQPLFEEAPSSPRREALLAAINGVLGDHLLASGNPLAIPMSLRVDGQTVRLSRENLTSPLPNATGRVVILLHGLCMNDLQWQRNGFCYGDDLAKDGFTPLHLHYNSGRHISENGREFATMLEQLVAAWPVPIEELVLLGHSMGGLVSRSACHIAEQEQHVWLNSLTKMIFLGSPHHGSPLEQGGNRLDMLIGASPYTVAFTRLGKVRSAGITDLRHGYVQDEDWQGRDRFAQAPSPTQACPLPERVRCYALAASMAETTTGNSTLAGDGLVLVESALGKHKKPSRTLAIPPSRQRVLHGMNHMDLLGHADVLNTVREWMLEPLTANLTEGA